MPNLSGADFLFPKNLQVTEIEYKSILVCGSCVASTLIYFLKSCDIGAKFTHCFFNNMIEMPDDTPESAESYDFQVIALPLRDIVSDEIVRFKNFIDLEKNENIRQHALDVLRLMYDASMKYNRKYHIPAMVLGFVVPVVPVSGALAMNGTVFDFSTLVRDLNKELARLVSLDQNSVFIDVDAIFAAIGKRFLAEETFSFYSHGTFFWDEAWKHDNDPGYNAPPGGRIESVPLLSEHFGVEANAAIAALWRAMDAAYRVINQIDSVKLVVFDLDDTLWRGQIAEHYGDGTEWPVIHGWPLGVWESIQHLRARGIIVAIASKNEVSIVQSRWERGVREPWIELSDFVFSEINWAPKAENIRKIMELAALTPKSVVFVDDNPVERESVRLALPGIRTIGSNPFDSKRILLWAPETQKATLTDESQAREGMMRQQVARENERATMSREDFLASLDLSITINRITHYDDERLARAIELLNKTNQFNTTGKRWTHNEISNLLEGEGVIYSFYVKDKFTEYGLVGVVILQGGHFLQFAMSCRVLGLGIEETALSVIVACERMQKPELQFTGAIIETEANIVSRSVYNKLGMIDRDGQKILDPHAETVLPSAHIKVLVI